MPPTKAELDGALSEIKSTLSNRESMIAKAYANHPDPNAWYLHFINCLSMIVQGPLSKVEESSESGSLTKAVKRRRVDDEVTILQGFRGGGRVLESEEDTTYKFIGPANFRVVTPYNGPRAFIFRTCLFVRGGTKVLVNDANEVEVVRKSGETLLLSSLFMLSGD